MDDRTPRPTDLSPADATLDYPPQHVAGGASSADLDSENACCGQVALIEGSGPELTRETQDLLRGRLRLAALVMFFGCLVFLP
ncbi:MAG: hypothetical protein ACYSWU_08945, partial [Planctomycetota bacterium]